MKSVARGHDARAGARLVVADREHQIDALAARLILAEEHERRRIAEGLHDEIGQNLVAIKVKLAEFRRYAASDEMARDLHDLIGLAEQLIRSTRSLTFALSSPVLHRLGLAPAVQNLLDRVAREHGLEVNFEASGEIEPLAPELRTLLYRSVRELLRNSVKHADASCLRVSLRRPPDRIEIRVEDDGVGFDAADRLERLDPDGGFGLFSIRHGLGHVGGTFDVESASGGGTRAVMSVALRNRKATP